jgi:predicted transcriptional regulator
MSDVQTHDIRSDALRMINALPDNATWDDVMQQIYVRQSIERGIKDADEGRVLDVSEVRRKFGLQP